VGVSNVPRGDIRDAQFEAFGSDAVV
jgi:hypothetical protein